MVRGAQQALEGIQGVAAAVREGLRDVFKLAEDALIGVGQASPNSRLRHLRHERGCTGGALLVPRAVPRRRARRVQDRDRGGDPQDPRGLRRARGRLVHELARGPMEGARAGRRRRADRTARCDHRRPSGLADALDGDLGKIPHAFGAIERLHPRRARADGRRRIRAEGPRADRHGVAGHRLRRGSGIPGRPGGGRARQPARPHPGDRRRVGGPEPRLYERVLDDLVATLDRLDERVAPIVVENKSQIKIPSRHRRVLRAGRARRTCGASIPSSSGSPRRRSAFFGVHGRPRPPRSRPRPPSEGPPRRLPMGRADQGRRQVRGRADLLRREPQQRRAGRLLHPGGGPGHDRPDVAVRPAVARVGGGGGARELPTQIIPAGPLHHPGLQAGALQDDQRGTARDALRASETLPRSSSQKSSSSSSRSRR